MFVGWFDPDRKKPAAVKLRDAAARYARKWGRPALVALVSLADAPALVDVTELEIRPVRHIAVNNFMVGEDDE